MCATCWNEAVVARRIEETGKTSQVVRVCSLYHEGFDAWTITTITGLHPLLVAYIIEDYA